MAVPIFKIKTTNQDQLNSVFDQLPTIKDNVEIKYDTSDGEVVENLIPSQGLALKRTLSYYVDNLPSIPEVFVPNRETQTTPRRVLNDTVDVTGDVGQVLGAVGDVVGEMLK